jgi:hypothetical protein
MCEWKDCPMEYQQKSDIDRSGGVQRLEYGEYGVGGGGRDGGSSRPQSGACGESMRRACGLNKSICYWSDEQVAVLKEERRGTRREALELDARPLRSGRLLRLLEGRVVQEIYCFLRPRISSSVNLRISDGQIDK